MEQMIEYEGQVYFRAEAIIDLLIDRLDALAMNITVFGDEWTPEMVAAVKERVKGFATATRLLAEEYIMLTNDMERARVYAEHIDRLDEIVEA